MARIKIKDLPKNQKISREALKGVLGGYDPYGIKEPSYTTGFVKESPLNDPPLLPLPEDLCNSVETHNKLHSLGSDLRKQGIEEAKAKAS